MDDQIEILLIVFEKPNKRPMVSGFTIPLSAKIKTTDGIFGAHVPVISSPLLQEHRLRGKLSNKKGDGDTGKISGG